jgi:futalosine hydrolase
MPKFSDFFDSNSPLLIAVASAAEAALVAKALGLGDEKPSADWQVVSSEKFTLLQTGVGKANAAGAVAFELALRLEAGKKYAGVLSLGIAGSLSSDVVIGDTVYASSVAFADEGIPFIVEQDWTNEELSDIPGANTSKASSLGDGYRSASSSSSSREWTSLEASGWAKTKFYCSEVPWSLFLSGTAKHVGIVATVSTISGTDELAQAYRERTLALAEDMEGAAVAQVCERLHVPFGNLRVISNMCGNREVNKLDIPGSFKVLGQLIQEWEFS